MNVALRAMAAGLLLLAAAVTAQAQRADRGLPQVERAVDAAARAQDRASSAQDRSSAAQDRADRAADAVSRAGRAAEAVDRAGDAAPAGRGMAASAGGRGLPAATGLRERHRELARANPQMIELVDRFAAVRGEIVAVDPSPAALAAAQRQGLAVVAEETIEGIDLRYVKLRVPPGSSLERVLADLRRLAPESEFAANHIHLRSGAAPAAGTSGGLAPSAAIEGAAIGLIDGGVGATGHVRQLAQQGFAGGAPAPDPHATALASLIAGSGGVKSAAPGAPLLVADVYGTDPKGGNALALARALGWMARQGVPVLVIGLVGPANPIVARAVKLVQARGTVVVAPVGNAGAAAPPMYPAAYPDVVGVTAVDSRNRALVEAGRGPHVDFAAPGADILAAGVAGNLVRVRGTSYAAPLVAGRLWLARRSARPFSVVAAEAVDLGRRGRDNVFGHGLVCATCR